jgi:putative ABC transport system permease protein
MAAGAWDGFPKQGHSSWMQAHYQNEEVKIRMQGLGIDYNLLETMGITILEGRDFSLDYGSELTQSVILNETAVKKLGIVDPIGEMFIGPIGRNTGERTIIGVVKDFNLHSIHAEIPPLAIYMMDNFRHILVRYRPGTLADIIPMLKSEWEKIEPDKPFSYSTIEDLFFEVYSSEKNLSTILSIAALFALFISALGLFGLTLFTARSRTKEIGIRRVFGSSENDLVYSFIKSSLIMVIAAALLSVPITLYFMLKWLHNFPYKVGIGWWIFVVAFLLAAIVVLSTVIIQSIKASRLNPVDTLRYE